MAQVNYELSVDPSTLEEESMACYKTHGLETLLTYVPPFLISREVVEFYKNLKRRRDGSVDSSVTLIKADGTEALFTFDVKAVVRSLFALNFEGDLVSSLTAEEIEASMKEILIRGKVPSTIFLRDIGEQFKLPIKVLKQTFIGMLGSRNQVSVPQQRLLTALFGNYEWNWEEAFLSILLEAAKSRKIRLGSKVSAIIIQAAKDEDTTWPARQDYSLTLLSHKEKAPKKKAVVRKTAATTTVTTESSSSSSEDYEQQPQPTTTTSTTQPQPTPTPTRTPTPIPSRWKPIPRSRGNVSSASPFPHTPSHTSLPSEAELTSALASSFPPEVELTSTSAPQATEIELTPASASTQLLPSHGPFSRP